MYQLRNLTETEKEYVLQGPIFVALLIGGADGEMSTKERERISELIHVKTYSLKNEVEELYEVLDKRDTNAQVDAILNSLPNNWEDRRVEISNQLSRVSKAIKKLDKAFATQYYKSLKGIAVAMANAAGGVFGIGAISESESEVLDLPMIEKP